MKIIAIDTSHNTSLQKTKAFLKLNADAEIIYTFDFKFYKYQSISDLWNDLNTCPDDFFSKPCAYYDMVTAIIAHSKEQNPESIIVFSPAEDECSRLSNEARFTNYINHFNKYHPSVLTMDYSIISSKMSGSNQLKRPFLQGLSIWDMLKLNDTPSETFEEYEDDIDDNIEENPLSITELIKNLFK